MPSEPIVQRVLEQVEGSHFSFIRFVGRISRHEWEWAPDDGMASARDVVADLMREERRVLAKLDPEPGALPRNAEVTDLATPATAAASLRGLRERTLAALRRLLASADQALADVLVSSAISLAQLDAHALGGLVILQRLIDPSRAPVSPR